MIFFPFRFQLIEDLSYEDVKKCYRGSVSLSVLVRWMRDMVRMVSDEGAEGWETKSPSGLSQLGHAEEKNTMELL